MSIVPIINSENNIHGSKSTVELPIFNKLQNNINNVVPVIDNINILSFLEIKSPLLKLKKTEELIPTIIEDDNLVLEMNGIGPQGPPGNGIEKIEKTSTTGRVDTYTIYFTNGKTFEYYITNGTNGDLEWYEGPYQVTPSTSTSQTLYTENLSMSENVEIDKVPYYEVSNLSGGVTATIGEL